MLSFGIIFFFNLYAIIHFIHSNVINISGKPSSKELCELRKCKTEFDEAADWFRPRAHALSLERRYFSTMEEELEELQKEDASSMVLQQHLASHRASQLVVEEDSTSDSKQTNNIL